MGFKLSTDARQYFVKIDDHSTTGKFDSVWDKFYLCLMIGISQRKLGQEPSDDVEFYATFHKDYNAQRNEIVAALIHAEILRQGIKTGDEKAVREVMLKLLDPTSPTNLSEDGMRLMNRYAQGGFEVLGERIQEPRELATFLKIYCQNFCD